MKCEIDYTDSRETYEPTPADIHEMNLAFLLMDLDRLDDGQVAQVRAKCADLLIERAERANWKPKFSINGVVVDVEDDLPF
jgi:hypothetical protein